MMRLARAGSLAALFVLALALASAAAANGPTPGAGRPPKVAPLSLVSESFWNSPNPAAPTWCLNEDDFHQRSWSGALSGSLTASERLCDASVDYSGGIWWDAGGIGVQADAYVVGTLTELSITSPLGEIHRAVLVDSTTTKRVTTNHYQVCYVPPFSISNNVGGTALAGGTWQATLAGTLTDVRYTLTVEMADVTFQRQYCPAAQQNLTP
jgi:hypothetical protein